MARPPTPVIERFRSKITIDETNECWHWKGAKDKDGYGTIYDAGRSRRAGRVAYELYRGPIGDGLVLDHYLHPGSCTGPNCVNPYHLMPTTRSANSSRNKWSLKTHCPSGHPYDSKNTIHATDPNGRKSRRCKICAAKYIRAWKAKHPELVRIYQQKANSRQYLMRRSAKEASRLAASVPLTSRSDTPCASNGIAA